MAVPTKVLNPYELAAKHRADPTSRPSYEFEQNINSALEGLHPALATPEEAQIPGFVTGQLQRETQRRLANDPTNDRLRALLNMYDEELQPFEEQRQRQQSIEDTIKSAQLYQQPDIRAMRQEETQIATLPELLKLQGQQADRQQQFANQLALQRQAQGARGEHTRMQNDLMTQRQQAASAPREARQAAALMLSQSRALMRDDPEQAAALQQRAFSMLPGSDPEVLGLVQEAVNAGLSFEDLMSNAGAIGIDPNDTQTLQEIQDAFGLFGGQ